MSSDKTVTMPLELAEIRAKFEKWHNDFYGPQDKYNPIRSLGYDTFGVGLGYDDPTVQAQFCAFQGACAAPAVELQGEPVAYAVFADNGNIRCWSRTNTATGLLVAAEDGAEITPLYTSPPAPVAVPDALYKVIHGTLRHYRMGTLSDGEGGGYPLIDAMSADGQSVSGGIEECQYLTDAIWNACLDKVKELNQ